MTELQVRRYLTRARARAEDNAIEDKLPYQWKGQRAAGKRKAIAVTDTDTDSSSASTTDVAPSSRATRATKRTASSRSALEVLGVKPAPKRKYTKNGGGAAKKTIVAAKRSKEVKFNDNKENLVPLIRGDPTTRPDCDDTDELMSSMGALSVKPIRVPSTKLRLPTTNTNVSSAFDPLPALSPSKARRIPQGLKVNDDSEMEDELSSPQPKLAAKTKRALGLASPTRGFMGAPGAMDLRKPLDLSASLLSSLARRPSASPFKSTMANTPLSRSGAKSSNNVPKSSLASPARRPPTLVIASFGSPAKGVFDLRSKVTQKETPHLSKPSVKSPPKRVKVSRFLKIDESEDELGMDTDNYMLGRSPTRMVKKRVGGHTLVEQISISQVNTIHELDHVVLVKGGPKETTLSTMFPGTSPVARDDDTVGAKIKTDEDDMDVDGDADIEDLGETEALMNQIALSPTKYKSLGEGRNSYGFFSFEDEEGDELSETRFTGNPYPGMDLQPAERKTLFLQGLTSKQAEAPMAKLPTSIPIDPFLLTLGAPANFVGIFESPSRTTTVPVKMHSVDDVLSEGESDGGENDYFPPNQSTGKSPTKRCSVIRTTGVLAGAVVFVDVYTSEGADASAAFVEALRGLGAKVLKNWNWNPNSTGVPGEGERKVGITHVVFKDGSPRTLQKVKDSKGVVLCVGVAWVTACEDEQSWVDEGNYPVDLDHVPRGGHRRRKSMEPKALIMTPGGSTFDNFSIPLKTPKPTPRKLLFLQTEILQKREDDTNPVLMHNLMMARRKSMQFAPKIGSPLRRFAPISMG